MSTVGGSGVSTMMWSGSRFARTAVLGVLVAILAMWLFVMTAGVADASCARPPTPSAHRFSGVVVTATDGGRTATVRTDDGRTVTVAGRGDSSGAITSVDRTYTAGTRYEFHPLNATSPYRDNACTATRQLSQPTAPGGGASGAGDHTSGTGAAGWLAAGAFALVLLVLGAVGIRRRAVNSGGSPAAPRR